METGYHSFSENFHACCCASSTRLAYERQQTDADYAARALECQELYKLLEEKLGDEHRLINRFDAAKNHMMSFDDTFIYQQGFQDCVYLLRWVGLL